MSEEEIILAVKRKRLHWIINYCNIFPCITNYRLLNL